MISDTLYVWIEEYVYSVFYIYKIKFCQKQIKCSIVIFWDHLLNVEFDSFSGFLSVYSIAGNLY